MRVLERICEDLDCDFGDIINYAGKGRNVGVWCCER